MSERACSSSVPDIELLVWPPWRSPPPPPGRSPPSPPGWPHHRNQNIGGLKKQQHIVFLKLRFLIFLLENMFVVVSLQKVSRLSAFNFLLPPFPKASLSSPCGCEPSFAPAPPRNSLSLLFALTNTQSWDIPRSRRRHHGQDGSVVGRWTSSLSLPLPRSHWHALYPCIAAHTSSRLLYLL